MIIGPLSQAELCNCRTIFGLIVRHLILRHFTAMLIFILWLPQSEASEILCSRLLNQSKISKSQIENITTLKILWDQLQTGALTNAQIAIAKHYPSQEKSILSNTGLSRIELIQIIKKETLTRNGVHETNDVRDSENRASDEIMVQNARNFYNPKYLATHMAFHKIMPGKFMMGESWVNKVETEISKPFDMMATLVTQEMWVRLKIAAGQAVDWKINPSFAQSPQAESTVNLNGHKIQMRPARPVEQVSWDDVIEFIGQLNQLSKIQDMKIQSLLVELIPDHQFGDIYDLPTEAQWEFVMRNRGNANEEFFDSASDDKIQQYAWLSNNSRGNTHDVATLLPREIGGTGPFYDLEGNVEEWMKDHFTENLPGGVDPLVKEGKFRLTRGGSARLGSWHAASYSRVFHGPGEKKSMIGFRLVRTRL